MEALTATRPYAVKDVVFYESHGIGTITHISEDTISGIPCLLATVRIENLGHPVQLRAALGIRNCKIVPFKTFAGADPLATITKQLRGKPGSNSPQTGGRWAARFNVLDTKLMKTHSLKDIAEVARDLCRFEDGIIPQSEITMLKTIAHWLSQTVAIIDKTDWVRARRKLNTILEEAGKHPFPA